ncbi:DUF2237 family protein [Aquidulcibacter paucihalophilus]|uniref:DUF2237 family protein n=1 Tax=Aquidulcibacter paucihalophilus TaxID=1978549 RepID=UPI000A1982A1|nr:DUF2237 domain-containing protein [Aquidulcibacter paucihalophilus]
MRRFDPSARNVLGGPLEFCSMNPLTGWFRNGCCETEGLDHGTHVVCAVVTKAFLAHQLRVGNDLITPRPEYRFAGLKPGDHWCVCLTRWKDALDAGCAPPIILEATHEEALVVVPLETLKSYAAEA